MSLLRKICNLKTLYNISHVLWYKSWNQPGNSIMFPNVRTEKIVSGFREINFPLRLKIWSLFLITLTPLLRRRSKNSRKTMKITYLSIYKLNTLYFITSCIIVVLLLRQTPPDKSSVKTILIIILLNFPVKEFQMFRSSQWYGVPLMLII